MQKTIIALLAVLLVAGCTGAKTGGGSGGDTSATPGEVARSFMGALVSLDFDAAGQYVSASVKPIFDIQAAITKELLKQFPDQVPRGTLGQFNVTREDINGNAATVEFGYTVMTGTGSDAAETQLATKELEFVKEGGAWKVKTLPTG